jgi:hypothetical protein
LKEEEEEFLTLWYKVAILLADMCGSAVKWNGGLGNEVLVPRFF